MPPSSSSPVANPFVAGALKTAMALHQSGRLAEAVAAYRNVLRGAPGNFDANHMLGVALVQSGAGAEGIKLLRAALKINPRSAACRLNLGNALLEAKEPREAARLFRDLLASGPVSEAAVRGFAQALNDAGQVAEAQQAAERGLTQFPKSFQLLNELGRAQVAAAAPQQAAATYRRALALSPSYTAAALNLGNTLTELKAFEEAEQVLRQVLAREPHNVQALTNLAHMYRSNWQAEKAIEAAQSALAIAPDDAGLRTFIGGCLIDLGRNAEAEPIFRQQIAAGEKLQDAVIGLSQIYKFKPADPEIALADRLLADTSLAPKDRKALLFARSKMEDDIGNPGGAIATAIAAKAAAPLPDMHAEYTGYVRTMMAAMDEGFFARHRPSGHGAEDPVFILGMPRSGTTLTEQIIASHPLADGAGELTVMPGLADRLGYKQQPPADFVARIESLGIAAIHELAETYLATLRRDRKPGVIRVTDKLPHNFETLWLIALLFPRARIIHCERNPVDVCISIFLRNFSDGHWYTRDLASLGRYYNFYREQLAHWKQACGLAWYENDYAALVAEPEPNIRRMIDFLGLPWDDKCLQHTETERSIHTFSKAQARQPIYKSSVERWRKYAPYIKPLLDELGIAAT